MARPPLLLILLCAACAGPALGAPARNGPRGKKPEPVEVHPAEKPVSEAPARRQEASAPPIPQGPELRVAVPPLQASGASPELAAALGGVVANELERIGAFKVTTSDAIRELIALERQKQLLGCSDDASCLTEIAGALGVSHMVTGRVTRLDGSGWTLELGLLDVGRAQRLGSTIDHAQSESELIALVPKAVVKLTAPLLAGKTGTLIVNVAEPGALLKVDDVARGTTPLTGRLTLPGGPHYLTVQKEGFVTVQKEVRVQPGQMQEEQITLVPSPDFIREYEGHQKRLRIGAWISTGVLVAGVATFGYARFQAETLYGPKDQDGTFLYHRAFLLNGVDESDGVNHRERALALKASIQSFDTIGTIGAAAAGLGACAAAYFWIVGEDPNRYARFRSIDVQAALAPMPGGAFGTATVRF